MTKTLRRTATQTGYSNISAAFNNHLLQYISGPQLKVYTALLSFAPNIMPSQQRLASLCGIKQFTTIQETLDQLAFIGLIEMLPRTHKTNQYFIEEVENMPEALSDRLQAFNSLNQKQRRETIKYWKREDSDPDSFHANIVAIERERQMAQLGNADHEWTTCVAQDDVDLNTCTQQGEDLCGTGVGTCSAPVQIVEAQKEKKKQKGAGVAVPSCAGAPGAADAAPEHPPHISLPDQFDRSAGQAGPTGPHPQADSTSFVKMKERLEQIQNRQSQASSTKHVPSDVFDAHPDQPISTNQCSSLLSEPASSSLDACHPSGSQHDPVLGNSVIPSDLPSWLDASDWCDHPCDRFVDKLAAASLLTYNNIHLDRIHGIQGQVHTTDGMSIQQGWIESKGWTTGQVKNVLWRVLLRYPNLADNESKIKGTALRILEEDSPDDYRDSSRLYVAKARALEQVLDELIFVGDEEVNTTVKIRLIDQYTQRLAYLPDHLIRDVVVICLRMGPLSSPGDVKPNAPIGIRVKAFKDRIDSVLAANRPGKLIVHEGMERAQMPMG